MKKTTTLRTLVASRLRTAQMGAGPARALAAALPAGGEGADLARLSEGPLRLAEGWAVSEPLGPGRFLCVATPAGERALRARGVELLPLDAELSATPEARALAAALAAAGGAEGGEAEGGEAAGVRVSEEAGGRRLRLELRPPGRPGAPAEALLVRRDRAGRVALRVSGVAAPAAARADWEAADALLRRALAGPCACDPAGGAGVAGPALCARVGEPARAAGAASWTVHVPPRAAGAALARVAALPFVAAVDLAPPMAYANYFSSAVMQSGEAPGPQRRWQGHLRPAWRAGLTGAGQLAGVGDTGLDLGSCFFDDPEGRRPGPRHRKVEGYREIADAGDATGHGSHVCGSLAGSPRSGLPREGAGVWEDPATYSGMAPEARVLFSDLGPDDGEGLLSPQSMKHYFDYAYDRGARVHTDSWGGLSPRYTQEAREVDAYAFEKQDFLPVTAAGNDGNMLHEQHSTVSTPATAKNSICVGSTLGEQGRQPEIDGGKAELFRAQYALPGEDSRLRVLDFVGLQAEFGVPLRPRRRPAVPDGGERPPGDGDGDEGGAGGPRAQWKIAVAQPLDACYPLADAEDGQLRDRVLLVQRGGCYFSVKARHAEAAGARAIVVFDAAHTASGFFAMALPEAEERMVGARSPGITALSVPHSTGAWLLKAASASRAAAAAAGSAGAGGQGQGQGFVEATVSRLGAAPAPEGLHDNIADFSSFGPTLDGRVKPDIVAPGELIASASTYGYCEVRRVSGTSMSAPLVAGAAVLAQQYFVEGRYAQQPPGGNGTEAADPERGFRPSGALLKAVILNGAQEMRGFTESSLPLEPVPSYRQGWGRTDISHSLPLGTPGAPVFQLLVADGVQVRSTGDRDRYCVRIPPEDAVDRRPGGRPRAPLRVTLAWMDAPGSVTSSGALLVNDLDLALGVPRGSAEPSAGAARRPDRVNNVERLEVARPLPGAGYLVSVTAHRVNWSLGDGRGQPYALAAQAPLGSTLCQCGQPGCGCDESGPDACPGLSAGVADLADLVAPAEPDPGDGRGGAEEEGEEGEEGRGSPGAGADGCACSEDGFSGGAWTAYLGCAPHMQYLGDESSFCYVADPDRCASATASVSVPGAAWREC